MPLVREVLAALRIPVVEVAGYEADDLIATLVREAQGGVAAGAGRHRRPTTCS